MKKIKLLVLGFVLISTLSFAQSSEVDIKPLDSGILQQVVTVTDTATAIPTTALSGRKSMIIKNIDSTDTIYLGSSTITSDENATGGYQLDAGETIYIDLGESVTIYGIVTGAVASAKVSIIEVR